MQYIYIIIITLTICLIFRFDIKDDILLLLKYFEHFKYLILDLQDAFQISQAKLQKSFTFLCYLINKINIYSNSFSSKSPNLENFYVIYL